MIKSRSYNVNFRLTETIETRALDAKFETIKTLKEDIKIGVNSGFIKIDNIKIKRITS